MHEGVGGSGSAPGAYACTLKDHSDQHAGKSRHPLFFLTCTRGRAGRARRLRVRRGRCHRRRCRGGGWRHRWRRRRRPRWQRSGRGRRGRSRYQCWLRGWPRRRRRRREDRIYATIFIFPVVIAWSAIPIRGTYNVSRVLVDDFAVHHSVTCLTQRWHSPVVVSPCLAGETALPVLVPSLTCRAA